MNDERQEALIGRVTEGLADPADWDALFDHGPREDTQWRRLAESLRDQTQLEALMGRAGTMAERVTLPAPREATAGPVGRSIRPSRDIVRRSLHGHWGGWRSWTGWAVAAALILAWSLSMSLRSEPAGRTAPGFDPAPRLASNAGSGAAIPVTPVSTEQAFRQYLERGQAEGTVLGVVPRRVILETRPNPSGRGYEMIYLQQIMERRVVPNLYQLEGLDERGRPGLVEYETPVLGEM